MLQLGHLELDQLQQNDLSCLRNVCKFIGQRYSVDFTGIGQFTFELTTRLQIIQKNDAEGPRVAEDGGLCGKRCTWAGCSVISIINIYQWCVRGGLFQRPFHRNLTSLGSISSFTRASFLIMATLWANLQVEIDSWKKIKQCESE